MKTVRVNYLPFHKYTLYVARIGADGKTHRESAPCRDCHRTLKLLGFRKLIYTTDKGIIQTRIGCIPDKDMKQSWGRTSSRETTENTGILKYTTGWKTSPD